MAECVTIAKKSTKCQPWTGFVAALCNSSAGMSSDTQPGLGGDPVRCPRCHALDQLWPIVIGLANFLAQEYDY